MIKYVSIFKKQYVYTGLQINVSVFIMYICNQILSASTEGRM
jgi:hypothetical protein